MKTSWSNAEFIPLKLSIGSAYILIATYFHDFFSNYTIPILVVFCITVAWSLYMWVTKMKFENPK